MLESWFLKVLAHNNMIKIINNGLVCKSCSSDYYKYSIIINDELITTFNHRRSRGLAECLLKASLSVKEKDNKDLLRDNKLRDDSLSKI